MRTAVHHYCELLILSNEIITFWYFLAINETYSLIFSGNFDKDPHCFPNVKCVFGSMKPSKTMKPGFHEFCVYGFQQLFGHIGLKPKNKE